jgi:hypothetical protein
MLTVTFPIFTQRDYSHVNTLGTHTDFMLVPLLIWIRTRGYEKKLPHRRRNWVVDVARRPS